MKHILGILWQWLRARKKYWLIPLITTVLFLALLILFAGYDWPSSPYTYLL